jgi:hypothetical protein
MGLNFSRELWVIILEAKSIQMINESWKWTKSSREMFNIREKAS